jgi:hypothetical protein
MAEARHGFLGTDQGIHIPYQWTYDDETEREAASGLVSTDVGKLARQLDDNSLWMLTDDDPVTWKAVGGGSYPATVATVALTDQTADISDTNLDNTTEAGTYLINYYIFFTATDGSTVIVSVDFGWADDAGSKILSDVNGYGLNLLRQIDANNTDKLTCSGTFFVQSATGPIQYSTTSINSYGDAVYSLYITVERLS